MCLLYGSGIDAFSYGAAASNVLSRGVRFASDAGSTVDCMQPPSKTPAPNRTTNIPVIISSPISPERKRIFLRHLAAHRDSSWFGTAAVFPLPSGEAKKTGYPLI